MGRAPCCEKNGLKKGPWTTEEDQKLIDYIQKNGYGNWRTLPKNAGLQRCGKSCRLRWTNYLRPDIKRGRFSFEEEETIIQLHSILGNKWSAIAARLPGRTDNEIKNYWNTHIRKRLLRMGIDPVTHSPRLDLLDLSSILTSNLYHNDQNSYCNSQLNNNISRLMEMQSFDPASNYYAQSQPDSFDPTRLIQDQSNYYIQDDHHQSLIQIQALQQQLAGYVSTRPNITAESILSDYVPMPPLTGFYSYGSEQSTENNSVGFGHPNGHNLSMNSVISTPSSSPTRIHTSNPNLNSNMYINSSCTSTEDERENNCSSLMKFEIPEIFDVNEFIQ
ncbi:hypothetical protein QQ045_008810 [Rhodiola kirilowii]